MAEGSKAAWDMLWFYHMSNGERGAQVRTCTSDAHSGLLNNAGVTLLPCGKSQNGSKRDSKEMKNGSTYENKGDIGLAFLTS